MTPGNRVAYHRTQIRHFLVLVDDELHRNELEEAANKLWRAAPHAIKAVAKPEVGNTTGTPYWKRRLCACWPKALHRG